MINQKTHLELPNIKRKVNKRKISFDTGLLPKEVYLEEVRKVIK